MENKSEVVEQGAAMGPQSPKAKVVLLPPQGAAAQELPSLKGSRSPLPEGAAVQKPRNYFIPAYSVRLVRDGSVKAETKLADSPERVVAIIRAYWGEGELDREHMVCLLLNARSQVLAVNTVSVGTLSATLVHPREVYKPAVVLGAAAVVVVHNLCGSSHKLCYVERPLMLSNRSESLLDRRNIERAVDGRDVLAAHKYLSSAA